MCWRLRDLDLFAQRTIRHCQAVAVGFSWITKARLALPPVSGTRGSGTRGATGLSPSLATLRAVSDRPLFDPSRMKATQAVTPAPGDAAAARLSSLAAPISVKQLNDLVRGAINRNLPPTVHVVGEIGDLSRPGSGHLYFSLKDDASELRCVMWRSAAAKLKFQPTSGLEVIATGGVEVYIPRGSYQLVVTRIEPRGVGALELAFRQLKEKLEREGLFAAGRKRPLPAFPRRVALVTSSSGAVLYDILRVFRRRFPHLDVLLFPVRVQGDGAAEEIAAALGLLNQHAAALGGIDVAIVARGGGSLEDLWAFNSELVARAIFTSGVPVVSAVGHETDFTIADFVADLRAATPTAAAELITPVAADLQRRLMLAGQRATRAAGQTLRIKRTDLRRLMAYEGLARPLSAVRERAQYLDELWQRHRAALNERSSAARGRLHRAEMTIVWFASGAQFRKRASELLECRFALQSAANLATRRADRRLGDLAARLDRARSGLPLERRREQLRQTLRRLEMAARSRLARAAAMLEARREVLAACDPQRVLERGFTLTREARTKKVIRSIAEIRDGTRILTQTADGEFTSTAENPRQKRLFE